MANETIDTGDRTVHRVPRAQQTQPVIEDVDDSGVVIEDDGAPTPESALGEIQQQLQSKDAELDEARARADQATREANEAKATAVSRTFSAQEQALASAIEAATATKATATAAVRTAREAGDTDAELAALDQFNGASIRLAQLTSDKERFEAEKRRLAAAPAQQTGQVYQPSPEAKIWLETHPRMDADDKYAAQAEAAHNLALRRGIKEGSRAYVDFIDKELEDIYGPNHGTLDAMSRTTRTRDTGRSEQVGRVSRQQSGSTAAPPSRGAETHASGGQYADTQWGRVTMSADGSKIHMPAQVRQQWEEAAKWNGMSLAEYAKEQLQIADEVRRGINPGLTTSDQVMQ